MTKYYSEQHNVGRSRYVVSFHDGIKTHDDGSPFYDVMIFRNRRANDEFVRSLRRDGYQERRTLGAE